MATAPRNLYTYDVLHKNCVEQIHRMAIPVTKSAPSSTFEQRFGDTLDGALGILINAAYEEGRHNGKAIQPLSLHQKHLAEALKSELGANIGEQITRRVVGTILREKARLSGVSFP